MSMLQSTNPVLADGRLGPALRNAAAAEGRATVGGVVNKTTLCIAVAVVFGAIGHSVVKANPGLLGIVNIVAFVASMAVGFALWGRPAWAALTARPALTARLAPKAQEDLEGVGAGVPQMSWTGR